MAESRIYIYLLIGLSLLVAVGVQRRLVNTLIPFPLIYILIGWGVFSLPINLPAIDLANNTAHATGAEYLTEFLVIASLSAAGIAIDRPFSWRCWNQVWPLLLITMPLSIIMVALFGWYFMGLTVASAIFLGAVLSPTDPVLASSVQVGPPGEEAERHDIRFNLTVEAGANDGLAFPFVHLGIAAIGMTAMGSWATHWLLEDLVWRVAAGVGAGLLVGKLGGWYVFTYLAKGEQTEHAKKKPMSYTSEGVVGLGAIFCAYALAEIIHGYGFLAVFISAVVAKQAQPDHDYHAFSHHFLEQVERVMLIVFLLILGAYLANGILDALTWSGALLGICVVFLIRPLAGLMGLAACKLPLYGKFTMAFLGVRGVGSLYYLTYGENHGEFGDTTALWSAVMFTILLSIVIHGVMAPVMLRKAEEKAAHQLSDDKDVQ
ncbi:cation:proton antiporter [Salinimonas sediminis]|uniref:Sodium:proton antiporter n=1 Tax=Salinimonas sediminis TaxID=2303538 RepID=A0A346NRQ0_9ALTE|nr:cation:proton antiporter [Salinimonas sediminis]AXR08207.1 sodium:proton antiporter [Salinimonas sediminis]